jgi:hypothetical protein
MIEWLKGQGFFVVFKEDDMTQDVPPPIIIDDNHFVWVWDGEKVRPEADIPGGYYADTWEEALEQLVAGGYIEKC